MATQALALPVTLPSTLSCLCQICSAMLTLFAFFLYRVMDLIYVIIKHHPTSSFVKVNILY